MKSIQVRTAKKQYICFICKSIISAGTLYKLQQCAPPNKHIRYCIKHNEAENPITKNIITNSGKITRTIPQSQQEINELLSDLCNIMNAENTFYKTDASRDAYILIRLLREKVKDAHDIVDIAIEKYITLCDAIGRQFGETEKLDYYRNQIQRLETWVTLLDSLLDTCNVDINIFNNDKAKAKKIIKNIIQVAMQVVEFYI